MDKYLVNISARYSDVLNVLYLNNPKAACSTIAYSLWMAIDRLNGRETFAGDVHDPTKAPFPVDIFATDTFDASSLRKAVVFSVVRNPFVRILSAYLDKIGKDYNVWNPFRERFGLRPDVTQAELSFPDFLRLVTSEPDELLDRHFCPQYSNLLLPFSKPAFIGHVEDMDEVATFLESIDAPIKTYSWHATNSKRRAKIHYDSDSAAMVREKYADDFRLFGYSPNLNELKDFQRVFSAEGKDRIIDWILTGKPPVDLYNPGQKAFYEFQTTASVDEKTDLVRRAFANDDNWARLLQYADFARRNELSSLHQDILERINALRTRHLSKVKNKNIFIPIENS